MAAETPPYVIQGSSHSADLFRIANAALLGYPQPGSLTAANGGIINPTDLAVTQNGSPNMSVNVAGGVAVIPQTLAANGGVYIGLNDATVNLAIAASNPSNPRIDIVVATVNDAAYSGGTNNWVLQVITGTPAASPSAPATPSSSILICQVAVAANASSIVNANITDKRALVHSSLGGQGNPCGAIYQGTLTAIANNTFTIMTNMGADFMKGGMITDSSSYIQVPSAGVYLLTYSTTMQVTQTTQTRFVVQAYKNGATVVAQAETDMQLLAHSDNAQAGGSRHILLAANDYLQLRVLQTNSGSASVNSTPGSALTYISLSLESV